MRSLKTVSGRAALTSVIALTGLGLAAPASASMGNIATSYGILPADIGSAQGLSLFNEQVSAVYYNPAYLANDPRGELTAGFLHAEPELRAAAPNRNGDILSTTRNQSTTIGLKTNLTDMTRFDHPIFLGVMIGVDKLGKEMLAFNSKTSEDGQFLEYGRQPLFLTIGGATTLWRGIDAGYSARVTLHSEATLSTTTDLAGNTQYEQLSVNAEPAVGSIFSTNIDFGETFCPDDECWASGIDMALAYRQASETETNVQANTVIPGLIPASDPLAFSVLTYDSYQPPILSAGLQYSGRHWRVSLTAEQQQWSELNDKFINDDVKDQANARFDDILVPRIGAEWRFSEHFSVRGGVAMQDSPLESTSTQDVNYFSNDKLIAGTGLTTHIGRNPIMRYPVRLDVGYQYQKLEERDFTLDNSKPNSPSGTVTTDGEVHVFTGSLTLKF